MESKVIYGGAATPDEEATMALIAPLRDGAEREFQEWLHRLEKSLTETPGLRSIEILRPRPPQQLDHLIILRFANPEELLAWRQESSSLLEEAGALMACGRLIILPGSTNRAIAGPRSVTEVVVTEVRPEKAETYRAWTAKVQEAQTRFPGFLGTHMQRQADGSWTTLLRYDSAEHLEGWLNSSVRADLLAEARGVISKYRLHRVEAAFPGWVGSDPHSGLPPARWKTTMLVLLSLYPIAGVIIEVQQRIFPRGTSPAERFVANTVSVILIGYVAMPFFVRTFRGWLLPGEYASPTLDLRGAAIVAALYAVEVLLFSLLF